MNFCSETLVIGANSLSTDATQRHPLGMRAVDRAGRVYRYCKAGAADLVAGNVIQGSVPAANHLAIAVAADAAIGATSVSVTLGATAAAENLYAEGWLQVDTTPGNGYMYYISGHAAIGSGGTGTIYLGKDDAVSIALTAAGSKVGLIANPYKGVLQCPTTKTAAVVGVAVYPITAAQFGWLLTWGPAPVLINGTPAVTAPVINSATTAGAADVWTAAAQPTSTYIGEMLQVGVSGKNNAVFVRIGS